jgi:hypothetical protein
MLDIGETTIERGAPGLFDFYRILCVYPAMTEPALHSSPDHQPRQSHEGHTALRFVLAEVVWWDKNGLPNRSFQGVQHACGAK